MHLTCPSCGATFLVEPEHLGPAGRRVRCGECAHTWHQARPSEAEAKEQSEAMAAAAPFAPAERLAEAAPAEPAAEPAAAEPLAEPAPARPVPEPAPEPADAGERGRRRAVSKPLRTPRTRRESSLVAGWILFCVVVAGLFAGFYFGRTQLVAMVPQMTRLYDLVGLGAAPAELGLELRDVKSVWRLLDGERVVVIEGQVVNVSAQTRQVPVLRASLTDAAGVERERWTFEAAEASLAPGETTGFETIAKNPPRESHLSIDFVLAD